MALSYEQYVGDGSTITFAIPFPYLEREHIKVYVDGVEDADFSFDSDAIVRLSAVPANGALVLVRRETPYDERSTDFENASILDETTLDNAQNEIFYIVQEAVERIGDTIRLDESGVYDAQGRRIINVGTPIDPEDALTMAFFDHEYLPLMTGMRADAVAAAEAASVSEANALGHAEDAEASADAAALSATEAANILAIGERTGGTVVDFHTCTAGQTIFAVSVPANMNNIMAFMNSRKLRHSEDYTLDSDIAATVLTLSAAAAAGDELEVFIFNTFDVEGIAAACETDAETAETQAGIATTQAGIATTQAGNALFQANLAFDQAVIAVDAAGDAEDQADISTTQAGIATTQAGIAEDQADIATTQAGIATTKAGEASDSYDATLAIFGDATDVADAVAAAADSAAAASDSEDAAALSEAATAADVLTIESLTASLVAQNEFFRNELLKVMVPEQADTLLSSSLIKDVFIYDTTKDSDGGAWRLRCQDLSWYNEPLNTETRGGTREFPAVALIVATAGTGNSQARDRSVTIYDATVTGCPMWMRFSCGYNSSTLTALLLSHEPSTQFISAVAMKNGVLSAAGSGVRGLYRIDFLKDYAFIYSSTLYVSVPYIVGEWLHGIGRRNEFLSYNGVNIIAPAIMPSVVCNDVAMTVLDDAPIDPDTLLPVPTIAVATADGVAVIDGPAGAGTLVTSTSSSFPYVHRVYIGDIPGYFTAVYGTNVGNRFYYGVSPIPSADDAGSTALGTTGQRYRKESIPSLHTYELIDAISFKAMGTVETAGAPGRLSLIKADTVTQANGSIAYITNAYNTGWMKGDIRRAFICDAIQKNLVSNGTFDDATGWGTLPAETTISGGTLNAVATTTNRVVASSSGVIEGLKKYSYSFTISGYVAGAAKLYIGSNTNSGEKTANGTYTGTITADGGSTVGILFGPGTTASVDNVSVVEVEPLTNLVSNGTFDTDTTGWTKYSAETVFEVVSGWARITVGGSALSRVYQALNLVVGRKYILTLSHDRGSQTTGNAFVYGRQFVLSGDYSLPLTYLTESVTGFQVTFTAATAVVYLGLGHTSAENGIYCDFDNISVTEVIEDRSVKASALTVTGTLTREPVASGAELQCVTGWALAANRLEQAYSADLNFGTGDFYASLWVKPALSTSDYYFTRGNGSAGGMFFIGTVNSSPPRFWFGTSSVPNASSNYTLAVTPEFTSTEWTHLVGQRISGVLYIYVNGKLAGEATEAVARNVDSADAYLGVGKNASASTVPAGKRLTLLRIGAGSLTEAQIAEMYRTELPLFQPNAKCTLQGTSNDVKGLAYDERYNLLAATHGNKVSIFRDLEVEDVIDLDPATGVAVDINNKGVLIGTSAGADWDNG